MRSRTELGLWFHGPPPLATIIGAIVATDAGTTQVGIVMALAYESAPGEYHTRVASGVGASQLRGGDHGAVALCPPTSVVGRGVLGGA